MKLPACQITRGSWTVHNMGMAVLPAANRMLELLAALGVFGLVVLSLTAFVGFERPNTALVIVSSVLIFLAPLGLLLHLAFTSELTREEKGLWIREFTSRRAATGVADYLTSHDRKAAIRGRVESAASKDFISGGPPAAP